MRRFATAIGISGPKPSTLQRIAGFGTLLFCGLITGQTLWWTSQAMFVLTAFGTVILIGLLIGSRMITKGVFYITGFSLALVACTSVNVFYYDEATIENPYVIYPVICIFIAMMINFIFYASIRITYYYLEPTPIKLFKSEAFVIRYCIPIAMVYLFFLYIAIEPFVANENERRILESKFKAGKFPTIAPP